MRMLRLQSLHWERLALFGNHANAETASRPRSQGHQREDAGSGRVGWGVGGDVRSGGAGDVGSGGFGAGRGGVDKPSGSWRERVAVPEAEAATPAHWASIEGRRKRQR